MMTMILLGTASVCGLMLILWLIHLPIRNAAIVDAGWAGGLAMLAVIYAVLGDGWMPRRVAIGAMVLYWGFRLGLFLLLTRVIGHPEEGRYVELRRKWGSNIALKFLAFFEVQALLDVVLSAPFLLAALDPKPHFTALETAGVIIWLVAFMGEIVSDAQLRHFKMNSSNRGKTCQVGLWHYSRHPNYFFEFLIWIGYALYALDAPYGFVGLLSPALILYFLLRLSGIPATEAQALRSRGDEYRAYQRTTSVFVPWFPKKA